MAEITDPELIGYITNAVTASLNIAEEHGYRRGLIEVGLRMADGSSVDDQMFADVTLTLPSSYDQYEPKDCICGVPPKICSGNHGTACLCTMCGLHGPWKSSTADAIQEWNAWTPLNLLVPKALHCPCGDSPTTYNGPAGNNIKCYSCGLEGGWHIVYGWAINSWNKVVNANRRGEWVGNLKRASAAIRGRNLSPDCKLPIGDSRAEIGIESEDKPVKINVDLEDDLGADDDPQRCTCGVTPVTCIGRHRVRLVCAFCGRRGPWAKSFPAAAAAWDADQVELRQQLKTDQAWEKDIVNAYKKEKDENDQVE